MFFKPSLRRLPASIGFGAQAASFVAAATGLDGDGLLGCYVLGNRDDEIYDILVGKLNFRLPGSAVFKRQLVLKVSVSSMVVASEFDRDRTLTGLHAV